MKIGKFNAFVTPAILGFVGAVVVLVASRLQTPVSALGKLACILAIFLFASLGLWRTLAKRSLFISSFGVKPALRGLLSAEDQSCVDNVLWLAQSRLKSRQRCMDFVRTWRESEQKIICLARTSRSLTSAQEEFNNKLYSAAECGCQVEHTEAYYLWPVPHPFERS